MMNAPAETVMLRHARRDAQRKYLLARGLRQGGAPLPFADEAFDVVVCIDAVLHLANRFAALVDRARLLRQSADWSLSTRRCWPERFRWKNSKSAQGSFRLAPPGLNEKAIETAGSHILECDARTIERLRKARMPEE